MELKWNVIYQHITPLVCLMFPWPVGHCILFLLISAVSQCYNAVQVVHTWSVNSLFCYMLCNKFGVCTFILTYYVSPTFQTFLPVCCYVNINLNFDIQLLLQGQEMLVVLLESGGCTVRYVWNILFLCVCLSYAIYTHVASLVKATSKLNWSVVVTLLNIMYVASHTYESAHLMNWPDFCPCIELLSSLGHFTNWTEITSFIIWPVYTTVQFMICPA